MYAMRDAMRWAAFVILSLVLGLSFVMLWPLAGRTGGFIGVGIGFFCYVIVMTLVLMLPRPRAASLLVLVGVAIGAAIGMWVGISIELKFFNPEFAQGGAAIGLTFGALSMALIGGIVEKRFRDRPTD